jgi:hypothetical protein
VRPCKRQAGRDASACRLVGRPHPQNLTKSARHVTCQASLRVHCQNGLSASRRASSGVTPISSKRCLSSTARAWRWRECSIHLRSVRPQRRRSDLGWTGQAAKPTAGSMLVRTHSWSLPSSDCCVAGRGTSGRARARADLFDPSSPDGFVGRERDFGRGGGTLPLTAFAECAIRGVFLQPKERELKTPARTRNTAGGIDGKERGPPPLSRAAINFRQLRLGDRHGRAAHLLGGEAGSGSKQPSACRKPASASCTPPRYFPCAAARLPTQSLT